MSCSNFFHPYFVWSWPQTWTGKADKIVFSSSHCHKVCGHRLEGTLGCLDQLRILNRNGSTGRLSRLGFLVCSRLLASPTCSGCPSCYKVTVSSFHCERGKQRNCDNSLRTNVKWILHRQWHSQTSWDVFTLWSSLLSPIKIRNTIQTQLNTKNSAFFSVVTKIQFTSSAFTIVCLFFQFFFWTNLHQAHNDTVF